MLKYYFYIAIQISIGILLVTGSNQAQANSSPLAPKNRYDNIDICRYGSGEEAIEACKRELRISPKKLVLLLKLAEHLKDTQKYEDALAISKKALSLFPNNPKAKYIHEEIASLQKEQQWSRRREQKKLRNSRISGEVQLRLSRIRCLNLKGKKGLASCDEAIKRAPKDAELYHARGDILMKMGYYHKAGESYTTAFSLDPGNAQYQKKAQMWLMPDSKKNHFTKKESLPSDSTLASAKNHNFSQQKIIAALALLKALLDKSLISKKEYNQRKKQLLNSAFRIAKHQAGNHAQMRATADMDFGKYYALVIGIQDYKFLPKLQTAKKDAAVVAQVLENKYDFKVKRLFDSTRRQILLALSDYRKRLTVKDNLLIYYAGHGWLDEEADTGYWLPVNAAPDNDVDWVSLNTITASIRAIQSKHVMIVADSCYSGKLTRSIHIRRKSANYFERMVKKRTRVVLTSGGLEPVLDSGGSDGHSVFASAFLNALQSNRGIIDGTMLFTQIRRPVMLRASQTPEYSDIRKAGHEGGDFIFVRRGGL